MDDHPNELTIIDGIGEATARQLNAKGYFTLVDLAQAAFEDIMDIRGDSMEWIREAQQVLNDQIAESGDVLAEAMMAIEDDGAQQVLEDQIVESENALARVFEDADDRAGVITLVLTAADMDKLVALRDTMAAQNHLSELSLRGMLVRLINAYLMSIGSPPLAHVSD